MTWRRKWAHDDVTVAVGLNSVFELCQFAVVEEFGPSTQIKDRLHFVLWQFDRQRCHSCHLPLGRLRRQAPRIRGFTKVTGGVPLRGLLSADHARHSAQPISHHRRAWRRRYGRSISRAGHFDRHVAIEPCAASGLCDAGVNYFLERSDSLRPGSVFSSLATNIPGQPGQTSFTDTNAMADEPWFYRVGVNAQSAEADEREASLKNPPVPWNSELNRFRHTTMLLLLAYEPPTAPQTRGTLVLYLRHHDVHVGLFV